MPLTDYQRELLAELAASPAADERYLAGGAALHLLPNSLRISEGLDFFHDSVAGVGRPRSRVADRQGRLNASGEWFDKIDPYVVMQGEDVVQQEPAQVVAFDVVQSMDEVFNWALGVE